MEEPRHNDEYSRLFWGSNDTTRLAEEVGSGAVAASGMAAGSLLLLLLLPVLLVRTTEVDTSSCKALERTTSVFKWDDSMKTNYNNTNSLLLQGITDFLFVHCYILSFYYCYARPTAS